MRHWARRLAPFALGLTLALGTATPSARAQEEQAAEGEEKGRPWDGYIATGLFAFLVLFMVGKSARR